LAPQSFGMRLLKHISAILIIVAPVAFIALTPAPALAYSGSTAASYADYYWNKRNSNYDTYISDDCADFVSQALHDPNAGGNFHYVGTPLTISSSDDTQWWMSWSSLRGFHWTNSFVRVVDLYQFLMVHYPGGWYEGSASSLSQQQATYTPDSVVTGDLLFYDWDSNGVLDHVGIQVGWGTDPGSGWYGNYQDQHTTDRSHAFWSLLPYNSQWATTTINFVHVDAGN
jgi:hypothetical protein